MGAENEFRRICRAIARIRKAKKVSYRELAARIRMSESGLKKIFSGQDASFQRIAQICEALGVSMNAVMNEIDGADFHEVSFSSDQQTFFLSHMDHFYFYWKLVYERVSVDEIERLFHLTPRETAKYLKSLADLGMIKAGAGRKPKIPDVARIRWAGHGPLVQKVYREWGVETTRHLARTQLSEKELFIIRCFKLQESSYKELLEAQRELETRFVKQAIREMSLDLPGLQNVRWVAAIDDKSFISRIK
jgi:transcriptional regulator with XRE-family HTH domain